MCISTLQRLTKYPGHEQNWNHTKTLRAWQRWRQEKILRAERETQYESGVRVTSYILAVALETRRAVPSKAWTKIIFNLESDVWPYHPSNLRVERCFQTPRRHSTKMRSRPRQGRRWGRRPNVRERQSMSPGCQRMTILKPQLCCSLPEADLSRLEQIEGSRRDFSRV